MAKLMLIDASHLEETRVVVVSGNRVEEFDFESASHKPLKGNIYLAKVTRVEPSLQAAFVDYGGNRHGFLAFSEIHPDYYRIPVSDRQALIEEAAEEEEQADGSGGEDSEVETLGGDETEEAERARSRVNRRYKIQEVVKRRQILLVQVTKEERGNKGAALTTYLSLAGRYCVLMPNTGRGGGISRKINNLKDRRRLKSIVQDLKMAAGTSVILRTAGAERTKAEFKRDYDFLVRLWDEIREATLGSTAPSLIHEEGDIISRTIRDLYARDIEEVIVDGEEGYKAAKSLMKMMIPSHARRVQPYRESGVPLFQRYRLESQLEDIHNPVVQLRSGGYIVLSPTEALVAVDVNSGRATKGRHIEETAYKTNLEAAEEVARQLRLRDLAGLIVIDFIDMDEGRNNAAVERCLKEAMKTDRARIQIGRISAFGLLELSRQRLRTSLAEASSEVCHACGGTGLVRSTESTALHVLRAIEEEGLSRRGGDVLVSAPIQVALYILNQKRAALEEIERRHGFRVMVAGDNSLVPPDHRMERVEAKHAEEPAAAEPRHRAMLDEEETAEPAAEEEEKPRRRRRSRGRRPEREETVEVLAAPEADEAPDDEPDAGDEPEADTEAAAASPEGADADDEDEAGRKRRRRGRRGGRRRTRRDTSGTDEAAPSEETGATADTAEDLDADIAAAPDSESAMAAEIQPVVEGEVDEPAPARRRRAPRKRRPSARAAAAAADTGDAATEPDADAPADDTPTDDAPADVSGATALAAGAEPSEDPEAAPDAPVGGNGGAPSEPVEAEHEPANGGGERAAAEDAGDDMAEDDRQAPDESVPPDPARKGWWTRLTQ